jgi:predicted O-methyltransferase YrrM
VVHLLDAFPEVEELEVDIGRTRFRRSNLDPYERFAVGSLATLRQPLRIFEIGTYDGATTLLLARCAPKAEVFTLDLPQSAADAATVAMEVENAKAGVGSLFAGQEAATRITQLFGDSRSFDFSPWFDSIDLVLIDGGHEYEVVSADTATAKKLLNPRRGVAVWDDYMPGWPGVVRAVDESGLSVFSIAGTDLAVHVSGRQA